MCFKCGVSLPLALVLVHILAGQVICTGSQYALGTETLNTPVNAGCPDLYQESNWSKDLGK